MVYYVWLKIILDKVILGVAIQKRIDDEAGSIGLHAAFHVQDWIVGFDSQKVCDFFISCYGPYFLFAIFDFDLVVFRQCLE